MVAIAFDTLKFTKKLKEAGFPDAQAEAVAGAFREAQDELEVATKIDIELLRRDLIELEQRMTIKLGGLMVAAIGIVATLVKLL